MLAAVYDIEERIAFDVLTWISQQSNTKLRTVAKKLVSEFRALSGPALPERNAYDLVLLELVQNEA